jgi:hypothetical protein
MERDSYTPRIDFKGTGNSGSFSEEINSGPAPKMHPADRVCETEGCGTRLTRYNPNEHCYTHQRVIDNAKARNAPKNKKIAS